MSLLATTPKRVLITKRSFCTSTPSKRQNGPVKIAVVGSGPAGLYTVDSILENLKNQNSLIPQIDIYERLPTPFGLVRFGVACDHPEVKNVTHKFEQLLSNPKCRFFGNVDIGTDISVDDMQRNYHAVVLAYGCASEYKLKIPGEDLNTVYSAREFVAWLNGHPDFRHGKYNLHSESAVIIGQGNVALDVARILGKPHNLLQPTDIVSEALKVLQSSRVQNIHLVGRRGPTQAAFTTAELREMLEVPNLKTYISKEDMVLNESSEAEIKTDRPKRRMYELLSKKASIVDNLEAMMKIHSDSITNSSVEKNLFIHFLYSPVQFDSTNNNLTSIRLERNKLTGAAGKQKAVGTGSFVTIPCGVAFRSIGYKGLPISGLPFDEKTNTIKNENGRVGPGLYVTGWIKRGASGIIGTNKWDAEETVLTLLNDINRNVLPIDKDVAGSEPIVEKLKQQGKRVVSVEDWKKIDTEEVKVGNEKGKSREKMTDINDMLKLIS